MAFSKNRRLADLVTATGEVSSYADASVTHADLHTDMNLTTKTVLVANASTGDSDTTAANTAFVQQEIAALVDSAPGTLNTLNELAASLGDDASFSTTVTNSIATKLPLAGGTLSGNLVMGDNNITGINKLEILDSADNNRLEIYGNAANGFIFDMGGTGSVGTININDFNVGIAHASPKSKLSIVGDGSSNTYSGVIGIENTGSDKWGYITLTDDIDATTNSSNYYLIGRGDAYTDRHMSFHIPTAANYGSGSQPKFLFGSSGDDTLMTIESSTGTTYHKGSVGIGNASPETNLHIGSGTAGENLGVKLSRGATTNFFVANDGTKSAYIGVDNTQGFIKMGSLTNHPVSISQNNGNVIYIDTSNHVIIGGTANASGSGLSKLTVGSGSGDSGISIYSGTGNISRLMFADGTGSGDQYDGFLAYEHGNRKMGIGVAGTGSYSIAIDSSKNVDMLGTGSLTIPTGTTAQRPSSPTNGMIRFNTTIGGIEEYRGSSWTKVSNLFSASGGNTTYNITLSGVTYKVHVFTSSGTFTASNAGNVDVLVVAGGGAGNAAGGGAGGLIYNANKAILGQAYTITVGAGGAAITTCGGNCGTNHGANSTAFGLTANKGMGANGWDVQASTTMNVYGSGAGSGHSSTGPYIESGYTTGQGHGGGAENVNGSPYPGSGGGGAGGTGGATSSATAQGAGGLGLNYGTTFGTSVGDGGWFASGGVGSCHHGGCAAAYAGPGGGGDNTDYATTNANRNGVANTGGGGAGAHNGGVSGAGGSGVVIVRYAV